MAGEQAKPTTRRDDSGEPEGAGENPLAGDPYKHLRDAEEARKEAAQSAQEEEDAEE